MTHTRRRPGRAAYGAPKATLLSTVICAARMTARPRTRDRRAFDRETLRLMFAVRHPKLYQTWLACQLIDWRLPLMAAFMLGVLAPSVAQADPITATILLAVTGLEAISATVVSLVTFAVLTGASIGLNLLTAPKTPDMGQRQATVTQLLLGESPREAIVGRAGTGGSLVDVGNYGGDYGTDSVIRVIAVADHQCRGFPGYWVGDNRFDFVANGLQHEDTFANFFELYWHRGEIGDSPDSIVSNIGWTATDKMSGMAYLIVRYTYHEEKMPSHPELVFEIDGALIYDPREDPSVEGGNPSGTQSWIDPDTWAGTANPENAALCEYQYRRGFYALRQVDDANFLTVGRGLTEVEAPPARVIAWANICDEAVNKKGGGTEPRYRVGGVIRSTDRYRDVAEMFAAAMGGVIIQPEGGIEVEPGHAKAVTFSFTDADLVAGAKVVFNDFVSPRDRVNSVVPRYVEPAQRWRDQSAPIRRDLADVTADGGPHEDTVGLALVPYQRQAQRVAEIRRRLARLERSGGVSLPPPFAKVEEGDWGEWTSDRYLDGAAVKFRAESVQTGADYVTAMALREITSAAFNWLANTDEADFTLEGLAAPKPDPIVIVDFAVSGVKRRGDDGSVTWHAKGTFTAPTGQDAYVRAIEIQTREVAGPGPKKTDVSSDFEDLEILSGVLPGDFVMEARARAVTRAHRAAEWTDWETLTTGKAAVASKTASGAVVAGRVGRLVTGNAGKAAAFDRTVKSHGKLAFCIFLTSAANGDPIEVQTDGISTGHSGLTPGAPVYAGADGTPTSTPPSSLHNTVLQIGKCEDDATSFRIRFHPPQWIKELG